MISQKGRPDRAGASLVSEDRRRSQRVIIRMPVKLEVTKAGQKISLEAHTIAVNIHGAMVVCKRPFDAETKLEIINRATNERASARVTRTPRETSEGYLTPIEFSKPSPAFWQISFPSTDWKPSSR